MNKTRAIHILLSLVAGYLLTSHGFCQETPKTMLKTSTRLVQAKVESSVFAAEPKTTWRAGTKYARVAEVPDTQNHIHGLMIVSEPDLWIINLFDKSGRHIVDPGPSFDVYIPIFHVSGDAKKTLDVLEFGSELQFFTGNGAKQSTGEVINGKATGRYDATVSGSKLTLWTDAKSKKPVRVSLTTGADTQTIEYLSYEDDLPFDPSLFRPPTGIAMHEPK